MKDVFVHADGLRYKVIHVADFISSGIIRDAERAFLQNRFTLNFLNSLSSLFEVTISFVPLHPAQDASGEQSLDPSYA
jgi:hypothetical protein